MIQLTESSSYRNTRTRPERLFIHGDGLQGFGYLKDTSACHAWCGGSRAGGHQISQVPGHPHTLQLCGSILEGGASALLLPSGRTPGFTVQTS